MTLRRSARLLKRTHDTQLQANDSLAEVATLPALTLEQEFDRLNERIAVNDNSIQDQVTKIQENQSRIRELELFLDQKIGGNPWTLDDWERLQRKLEKNIRDLERDLGERS